MKPKQIQIDVLRKFQDSDYVLCHLIADGRVYEMILSDVGYQDMIREGFFLRNGQIKDSAGILNTTKTFFEKEE